MPWSGTIRKHLENKKRQLVHLTSAEERENIHFGSRIGKIIYIPIRYSIKKKKLLDRVKLREAAIKETRQLNQFDIKI